MMRLEQITQKEKYYAVHHYRNFDHPVAARLFRFQHKPEFPENRRVDPHFDCSRCHPHHPKPIRDHLASHTKE